MIALYILGGILLLNLLIFSIPVGVEIELGESVKVKARVGFFSHSILPKQEKRKKKSEKQGNKTEQKGKKEGKKKELGLTAADIRSAVPAIWESLQKGLSKTRTKMTIDPLTLCVMIGGDDPAEVAQWYGWASGTLWTLMPQLQEKIRIPHPQIHLGVDFQAPKTTVQGKIGIRYRIGGLTAIGFAFARPVLKWGLAFLKKKKQTLPKSQQITNDTDKTNAA